MDIINAAYKYKYQDLLNAECRQLFAPTNC